MNIDEELLNETIQLFRQNGLSNVHMTKPLPGEKNDKLYFLADTDTASSDHLTLSNIADQVEEFIGVEVIISSRNHMDDYENDAEEATAAFIEGKVKAINEFIEMHYNPPINLTKARTREPNVWQERTTIKKAKKNTEESDLANQLIEHIKQNPKLWQCIIEAPDTLADVQTILQNKTLTTS